MQMIDCGRSQLLARVSCASFGRIEIDQDTEDGGNEPRLHASCACILHTLAVYDELPIRTRTRWQGVASQAMATIEICTELEEERFPGWTYNEPAQIGLVSAWLLATDRPDYLPGSFSYTNRRNTAVQCDASSSLEIRPCAARSPERRQHAV